VLRVSPQLKLFIDETIAVIIFAIADLRANLQGAARLTAILWISIGIGAARRAAQEDTAPHPTFSLGVPKEAGLSAGAAV